jgi:uncharacterized alpha-E superfamily protein
MLSRTADNLYWLARYMERAENTARILDVAHRMSGMALAAPEGANEWHSTILAAGCEEGFYAKYPRATAESAIDYLARDPENPSSILSCQRTARRNARAVRTALTTDLWEAVNATWLEANALTDADFTVERVRGVLEWVKARSLLFNGTVNNTMLRKDPYWFARLGTFVERADNTARILDVKFHILLPQYERVGGILDYYQWAAILRAVSALRSYHWVYRDRLKPWLIAELLILRPEMPRSLRSCLDEIAGYLEALGQSYNLRGECHRLAGQMQAKLRYGRTEEIFQTGLHEYLTDFIDTNTDLGEEIAKLYLW